MATGKRPPPPPLSQRPASVYPVTTVVQPVAQPVLPPPPVALYQSPFDSPAAVAPAGYDVGSSEAPDDYAFDISPEDAAYYIAASTDVPGAGAGGSMDEPLYDDLGYDDPDGLFDDPFFQDGFDVNFGDPFAAPVEHSSTKASNLMTPLPSVRPLPLPSLLSLIS